MVPFKSIDACEKTCPSPQMLRIKGLSPLQAPICAQVYIEFPKAWGTPEFTVHVDGKEVNARHASGSYSVDCQTQILAFFPGRPGTKQVTVTAVVAGKEVAAKTSFNWKGVPLVALINHFGDYEFIV